MEALRTEAGAPILIYDDGRLVSPTEPEDRGLAGMSLPQHVGRHYERIALIISYHLGRSRRSADEVEDLTQEVVVKALRHIDTFRYDGEARLIRWLSRLAVSVVIDYLRQPPLTRLRALRRDPFLGYIEPEDVPSRERTASSIARLKESTITLQKSLDAMDESDRLAIGMVILQGEPLRRLARATECSPDTAGKRVQRALQRLRSGFERLTHEHDR